MTDNASSKPLFWLIDSERAPLAASRDVFDDWAETLYFTSPADLDWERPPDAAFFSAEIHGGAEGELFGQLAAAAGAVPLIAVARLRSLAQAVSFFRAGAADYLPLPLEEEEVWERFNAAIARMARLAMQGMLVELEPSEQEPGAVSMSLLSARTAADARRETAAADAEEDILARLSAAADAETEPLAEPPPPRAEDEPVAVDGLPIPNLWEELPCGLLVFDSTGNLVFTNTLALVLFGCPSLAELQDMLENNRAAFAAHGANHNPLPDNQWPQVLAARTRTARSAVISIERRDRRRVWLRIDCMPHLAEGLMSRLSMTLVNLTGELPPLRQTHSTASAKRDKSKKTRHKK